MRLAFMLRDDSFGIVLPACAVILFFTALAWLFIPSGPSIALEGRVVGLGSQEPDQGSVPTASVEIDGKPLRIWMPKYHDCRVGDVIELRRRPTRWGQVTGPVRGLSPCRRA